MQPEQIPQPARAPSPSPAEQPTATPRARPVVLHAIASSVVLLACIYCSTGSLAPYGATHDKPYVDDCGYVHNMDLPQFEATYWMLQGFDPARWSFSVVLRRVLYPIVAYPFMKTFGFLVGGVVASALLHLAALIVLARVFRRRMGPAAATAGMWLLATYPGVAYWAGLPYSYASIVPCSIFIMAVLLELEEAKSLVRVGLLSLALGVLFTSYDFLPLFGFAALLMLLWQRRWLALPVAGVAMVVPQVLVVAVLKWGFHVPVSNGNTAAYDKIVGAWLKLPDFGAWWALLRMLPSVTYKNFAFSNFFFLPMLFLLAVVLGRRLGARLSLAEKCSLFAVTALYLFNNLAPPYEGWQLRGDWIPRLYQPVFVVYLVAIARVVQLAVKQAPWRRLAPAAVAVTVLLNASISFGGILHNPEAGVMFWRFYRHAPSHTFEDNLAKYGRRPLGFCQESGT